jgi:nicotinate dehydrogenase subunit A
VRSCLLPVSVVAGKSITTLEGLGAAYAEGRPESLRESRPESRPESRLNTAGQARAAHLHPLQEAFLQEQAAQCGYCTNGMIMSAASLLAQTPRPSDAEIRRALAFNLCRCGTHMRIVRAVQSAARKMA